MTLPVRFDWRDPRALFAPSPDQVSAPIPVPAWLIREFGSLLPRRVTKDAPVERLMEVGRGDGREVLRWVADPRVGVPTQQAIETLLWLLRGAQVGTIPTHGQLLYPSQRQILAWRGMGPPSSAMIEVLRRDLLALAGVRVWRMTPRPGPVPLTSESAAAWFAKTGPEPSMHLRTSGLLDIRLVNETDGEARSRTIIESLTLDGTLLQPEPGEPMTWIDPTWHAELNPVAIRFLHRLLDPTPPPGWRDLGTHQVFEDVLDALGLERRTTNVQRLHTAIQQAGELLERTGWLAGWVATRLRARDHRLAFYDWAPGDRLMEQWSMQSAGLERYPYQTRPLFPALVALGIAPRHAAEWMRKHGEERIRDLLQYLRYAGSKQQRTIRSPYKYLKKSLESPVAIDDEPSFRTWQRNQTLAARDGRPLTSVTEQHVNDDLPHTEGAMAPLTDPDDMTRRAAMWLAKNTAPTLAAPWLDINTPWRARGREGGGLVLHLAPSLIDLLRGEGVEAAWEAAAQELTGSPHLTILPVGPERVD